MTGRRGCLPLSNVLSTTVSLSLSSNNSGVQELPRVEGEESIDCSRLLRVVLNAPGITGESKVSRDVDALASLAFWAADAFVFD